MTMKFKKRTAREDFSRLTPEEIKAVEKLTPLRSLHRNSSLRTIARANELPSLKNLHKETATYYEKHLGVPRDITLRILHAGPRRKAFDHYVRNAWMTDKKFGLALQAEYKKFLARRGRRCRACNRGLIVNMALPGRTVACEKQGIRLPDDFEIPTCTTCGAEWLDPETSKKLKYVSLYAWRGLSPERQIGPRRTLCVSERPEEHDQTDKKNPELTQEQREDRRLRGRQLLKEIREDWYEHQHGPQGEAKSLAIVAQPLKLVPLEKITTSSDSENDTSPPSTDENKVLEECMRYEGLRTPVVVVENNNHYDLCQGTRQVATARKLGWSLVPALVLPPDTSPRTRYWAHVTDCLTQAKMHSYDVARAAQVMRDEFKVPSEAFAHRSGLTPKYVENLLRAIDNLPPLLMQKWRERRPIPVDYLFQWSAMTPEEAVASFNRYVGLHPRQQAALSARKKPRHRPN